MDSEQQTEKGRQRLLVFIVAYNAGKTIESVLRRIPEQLSRDYFVEVLIIDDSSQDDTFCRSELVRRSGGFPFQLTVLFNPVNQGYGGNQKIGFHYAIENNFDFVALVHGDGQYAPECLPELVGELAKGEADAVFGSRMLEKGGALRGGMPLYKFIGNKILTTFQNAVLGSSLSEFHSGYRLYTTRALARMPFHLNANDFHFDTEIIIQCIRAGLCIKELPIPTFYGDEVCHVNGLKYAWNISLATLQSRVQKYHIFYDRKFDCAAAPEPSGSPLLRHEWLTLWAKQLPLASRVLVVGRDELGIAGLLQELGHRVTVQALGLLQADECNLDDKEYLVFADDQDIAGQPEAMLARLGELCRYRPDMRIVLATGNIGFFLTRLLLLCGRFSYTRQGILSLRHHRFFTLRSLRRFFAQNGYTVESVAGLPLPYDKVFSSPALVRGCARLHDAANRIRPSLFAYQLLIIVRPQPSLAYLLTRAVHMAKEKQEALGQTADTICAA